MGRTRTIVGQVRRTAVTAAAYAGAADVVRVLVDAGADVDLQDDSRANRFSPSARPATI